ncbi:hypothetical protein [Paenarthrobacter sp. C1]|uniref:hypothetical protein n=1 Tax=Paenarthrobacter sp. C1 TaxID=3400220 RepID=UPI003BF5BE36
MQQTVSLPGSRHELAGMSATPPTVGRVTGSSAAAQEARRRLNDWSQGSANVAETAGLLMELYEPFRGMKPLRVRRDAWIAFITAEGLRVEDLDPRPSDEDVRVLACALVSAQMDQLAASLIVGVSQMSVSRYYQAATRSVSGASERAAVLTPNLRDASKPATRRETAERVVSDLVQKASEAPRVPSDALTLVVTSSAHVKEYVGEFISGLSEGAQLSDQGEALLLQAVRELEALALVLRKTGQRCVNA